MTYDIGLRESWSNQRTCESQVLLIIAADRGDLTVNSVYENN